MLKWSRGVWWKYVRRINPLVQLVAILNCFYRGKQYENAGVNKKSKAECIQTRAHTPPTVHAMK